MSNLAIYRKYRPRDFNNVYSQDTIVRILKNQIKNDHIGHAYLFSGIRGTGKTSLAKIFARAINCEHPVDSSPCGECPTCKALADPSNMDIIEIDAASNRGVDEIRNIRETISYPPTNGRYKVYIIDEIHMLTKEAFNALLTTLEEPPEHAVFILATTEPAKLPATILSRCQKFNVRPITDENLIKRMKEICELEQVKIEDEALEEIARRGGHSMRDALSILDQCLNLEQPGQTITKEEIDDFLGISSTEEIISLAEKISDLDSKGLLLLLEEIRSLGREDQMILEELTEFYKAVLFYKISGDNSSIYGKGLESIAQNLAVDQIYPIIEVLVDAHSKLRYNQLSQIVTDTALLRLVNLLQETLTQTLTQPSYRTPSRHTRPIKQKKIEPKKEQKRVTPDPEPYFEGLDDIFPPTDEELPIPEYPQENIVPEDKKESTKPEEKPIQATTEVKNSFQNISNLKEKLVEESQHQNHHLISTLINNSKVIRNKNGLFLILEDKDEFIFKTDNFSNNLRAIVHGVLHEDVPIYPKLKSQYEANQQKRREKKQEESKPKPKKKQEEKAAQVIETKTSEPIESKIEEIPGDTPEDKIRYITQDKNFIYEKRD